MPEALTRSGGEAPPAPPDLVPVLPLRDVRRKRPPALSFLLKRETLRKIARVASLLALDYAGIYLALVAALALKIVLLGGDEFRVALNQAGEVVPFAYLLTVLLFLRSDLYAERANRPGLARIVAALFQVTIVALIYALADGQQFSSYYVFYGTLFSAVIFIASLRWVHMQVTGFLLSRAGYRRRAVLVGTGTHIDKVAQALSETAHSPVDLIGFISLQPRPDNGLRSLGRIRDLPEIIGAHKVQEVIIADSDFPQDQAVELADICHQRGVSVHVAPSTMEILLERADFVPGQSVPLFRLRPPVFEGFDFLLKRAFDLVGAVLLLALLSPILIVTALAVKLTSRGPLLYRSARPGMGGEPFDCLKFRTMDVDAEHTQAELEERNEATGALFKMRADPRLTPIGGFLRTYSLDELPQLFNVLRGQMSLVGPRPLPVRDFRPLEEWHKKRYLVLPGMTGLWQVSGRSDVDFDELVRLDFVYLERWSVFLDLVIILKTIPALVLQRGAY